MFGIEMTVILVIFVFVGILALLSWGIYIHARERERYENTLSTLGRQLRNKEISEETYKQLLIELEDKYRKFIKSLL